jgi:hypothetical protein
MQQDYALSLEEIKRMMANAGGTNLAGQSMAGTSCYWSILRTKYCWRYANVSSDCTRR